MTHVFIELIKGQMFFVLGFFDKHMLVDNWKTDISGDRVVLGQLT